MLRLRGAKPVPMYRGRSEVWAISDYCALPVWWPVRWKKGMAFILILYSWANDQL